MFTSSLLADGQERGQYGQQLAHGDDALTGGSHGVVDDVPLVLQDVHQFASRLDVVVQLALENLSLGTGEGRRAKPSCSIHGRSALPLI